MSFLKNTKHVFVLLVCERVTTRYFGAMTAYACVSTSEKSLNSYCNIGLLHHIHHEKSMCVHLLKSSCNVTSLNLRLHCGNLFWIALSLNFYHFIPSLVSSPLSPGTDILAVQGLIYSQDFSAAQP